jgi:signal transduction histidine kinase
VTILSGKVKELINQIIHGRSNGNPAITEMTKSKFILKGINPDKFDSDSYDDPVIIRKLHNIAKELKIEKYIDKETDIISAYSTRSSEEEIVSEIKTKLNCCSAKLLIFFASSCFNQGRLSRLLQEAFEDCIVIGCSTAGEQADGELLKNSVTAMAISSNIVSDIKIEIIEHLKENLSVEQAFVSFEKHFNESSYSMDVRKYVGMVLVDGESMKEEMLMDLIGNKTNVYFIGGSAGDDLKFTRTYISANGKAYTDSAVLALLKMNDNVKFDIIKTQSFKSLDKKLVANKVNEEKREVIEFNNRPALLEYADSVGAPSIEDAPKYFKTNPVGLFVGSNDVFVRSPQQIKGTSILFYCNILEGMEVKLLTSTDIIEDTREALAENIKKSGNIDGIINFDCIERKLILEEKNLERQYGEIFKGIPTIGFATYGEEFIGHVNQTSTMLVFRYKKEHVDLITEEIKEFNVLLDREITEREKTEKELRDTIEKKRMEELQKNVEEERRRLKELKEYDRIKTEFFANISHEFRTPLNVIFSALQLYDINLKNSTGNTSADYYKYIKIMRQNCYRLLRLVNNLIDITKIDAGYFEINETNNNIIGLIRNITMSVSDYVESKGLTLTFDTDVEEKIIACDADMIERIILNLLSNAIKFTEPGGKITVSIKNGSDKICIKVKDTGRGIPKEKLVSIFERFVQVDKSLTRDHEGSGIGLSIVKTLVELHGGAIYVYSMVGRGTEFDMYFPCKLVKETVNKNSSIRTASKNCIEKINIEFSDIYK